MAAIFLSYRRDDTGPACRQLASSLIERLGKASVFFDIDSIAGGERFPLRLQQALHDADCIAVLIGPSWLTLADASGRRRLDLPDDFVHYEVATALASGKPVIPVLVQQAALPGAQALPPELAALAQCAPISLREPGQTDGVAAQLQRLALRAEIARMPRVAYPAMLGVLVLVALAAIVFMLQVTFGLVHLPPTLAEIMYDIVHFGGLVALFMGVWQVVRGQYWWWLPVWAALVVFAAAWPQAWRYPVAGGLGLALLVFAWCGPRIAAQIALWRVRVPATREGR